MSHGFKSKYDRHESSSAHRRRRRSRSRSRSREPEIQIQMKPLMLASDNDSTRQTEIEYIEGSSFQQKSFSSSRQLPRPFAPEASSTGVSSAGSNTSNRSQYNSMLAERAHDAAIFGQLTTPPPSSTLGSDPTESKERIISSVDTVKQLIHSRFEKPDAAAWNRWLIRLSELKEARAKDVSSAAQKRRVNGVLSAS
ncbi:hypothetical protein P879_09187 [Paragonimus westermani]|uniref:Uncharacterized protein n=1 Tax=Paragonimus westermani TaxID=34504 RepID=A0A8T0DCY0_9TREM|nr:hypothetical protein P879_09187 [Paragonimus westermani]